jgi:hypothetical protein
LELLERGVRELEEALIARAQRLGGQRLERVRERVLRFGDELELVFRRAGLLVRSRLDGRELLARLAGDRPSHGEARGERDSERSRMYRLPSTRPCRSVKSTRRREMPRWFIRS